MNPSHNHWRKAIEQAKIEAEWNQLFADYKEKYPEEAHTRSDA